MAGSDGNGKRINAGAADKVLNLIRVCELCLIVVNIHSVLNACKAAKFCLDSDIARMGVLNNFFRLCNIFLIRFRGTVEHHGSEAAVNTIPADLIGGAMVKVEHNRDFRVLNNRCLNELDKVCVRCIFACTCGSLQNDRRFQLGSCLGNTLDNFHIIYIECTDGVSAGISFFEYFPTID